MAVVIAAVTNGNAQNQIRHLERFNQILISPKINLVLIPGESEKLELEMKNIDPEKVNFKIKGNTLHVYLDDARKYVKHYKYQGNEHQYKEKQ